MFTLILSGIALMALLFGFIGCASTECDGDYWKEVTVSAEVDTLALPADFVALSLDAGNVDESGDGKGGYFINSLPFIVKVDSAATKPYTIVPRTFSDDCRWTLSGDTLSGLIRMHHRFYIFNDSVSSPVTIAITPGMKLQRVSMLNSDNTSLAVQDISADSLAIEIVTAILSRCNIGELAYTGTELMVDCSRIGNIRYYGEDYNFLTFSKNTAADSVMLYGSCSEYNLDGVEKYKAVTVNGYVKVSQTYNEAE